MSRNASHADYGLQIHTDEGQEFPCICRTVAIVASDKGFQCPLKIDHLHLPKAHVTRACQPTSLSSRIFELQKISCSGSVITSQGSQLGENSGAKASRASRCKWVRLPGRPSGTLPDATPHTTVSFCQVVNYQLSSDERTSKAWNLVLGETDVTNWMPVRESVLIQLSKLPNQWSLVDIAAAV